MNFFEYMWVMWCYYFILVAIENKNNKIERLEQVVMDTNDDLKYILRYCNFTV